MLRGYVAVRVVKLEIRPTRIGCKNRSDERTYDRFTTTRAARTFCVYLCKSARRRRRRQRCGSSGSNSSNEMTTTTVCGGGSMPTCVRVYDSFVGTHGARGERGTTTGRRTDGNDANGCTTARELTAAVEALEVRGPRRDELASEERAESEKRMHALLCCALAVL